MNDSLSNVGVIDDGSGSSLVHLGLKAQIHFDKTDEDSIDGGFFDELLKTKSVIQIYAARNCHESKETY